MFFQKIPKEEDAKAAVSQKHLRSLWRMTISMMEMMAQGARVAATAVAAVTMMMAKKTAPTVKPAPQRLTLLDEAALGRTFVCWRLHTCIFVGGGPPSKLLFCKL
jgi:hypothetical protein